MNKFSTGLNGPEAFKKLVTIAKHSLALFAAAIIMTGLAQAQVQIGSTNYTTLTDALNAVNAGTHTGDITVLITGNTTETDLPAVLPGDEAPANWTSLTVRPSGGARTITANSAYMNFFMYYASNVTIDGSMTPGGTTRDLTFANIGTDAGYSGNVQMRFCSNITIKNVIMYNSSSSMPYGVFIEGSSNVTVENCKIYRTRFGVTCLNNCSDLTVTKNFIGASADADKIGVIGIYWSNVNGIPVDGYTISDNEIDGVYNSATSTWTSSVQGIRSFEGINGSILRNKIHNLNNQYAGVGAYGIDLRSNTDNTSFNTLIANNSIYGITAASGYPIGITLSRSSDCQLYNNTVNMTNTTTTMSITAGLWINPYSITNIKVKNNIVVNNLGTTGGSCYGFYHSWSTNAFTELDYNDYYIYSSSATNYIGYFSGNQGTLAAWQTAVTGDANATTTSPEFVSSTDMHLNGASIGNTTLMAPRVSDVTVDIDNEARNTTTYMGSDEVNPVLGFTTNLAPFANPFCAGNTIAMSVAPRITGFADGVARTVSSPAFTYEWYHNGTKINSATAATYTINSATAADAGTYYVIAKLGGASVTSTTITVAVELPITITSQPPAQFDACEGNPSLTMSVGTAGTVTGFQWQKETTPGVWSDISGQTSPDYTMIIAKPQDAIGSYRVKVVGPGRCGASVVYSNTINVNVASLLNNPFISYEGTPSNICVDDDIILTANAGGTIMGYQWQVFENGQFKDLDIKQYPTADEQTLIIPNAKISHTGLYRVRIIGSPNCDITEVYTEPVDVHVWPMFEIAEQPQSELVCYGGNVELKVIAIGTVYKYQWQKDGKNITLAENSFANSPILILNKMNEKASGTYTVLLTIEDCRGRRDVSSVPALVYVLEDTKIMEVTTTQAVQVGGRALFNVAAHVQGAPGTYQVDVQWYRGTQPLSDNDRISGAKSSILSIRDVQPADVGNDYWVTVSGLCRSDTAKGIEIMTPGINITNQPVSIDRCTGETANLTVQAQALGGGKSLEYQWFRNGEAITDGANVSGATTASLTLINLTKADQASDYYVMVTVQPGSFTLNSDQAAITVSSTPTIRTQPQSTINIAKDADLNITVEATGENLNYQWFKDEVEITGATAATYTKPLAGDADEGVYKVKVWNNCGEIYSNTSSVVVTLNMIHLGLDDQSETGSMLSNEPNPFSGQTTIIFNADKGSHASLSVTDIYGRQIAMLFDGTSQGSNRVTFDAGMFNLASGVYYYTLTSGGTTFSKPMLLVK